ncbi:MAG: efflux RND transporter periplasmic adaptor subunit, partial [Puniceicoccaceae bacterium]
EARISRISPFLEAGSFSTEASIDLANPDGLLRSGMYVDVDVFFGESETATLVPISALHEIPRRRAFGVFVVAADPSQDHLSDGSESSIDDRSSVRFQEVGIIARGRRTAGVTGLPPGAWVVATGHDLLSTSPADEETQAVRVRPIDWDRLIALQGLQSQDVLSQFLQRQRGNASAAAN